MTKQQAMEALDGLMLGDGSIRRYLNSARYHMAQSRHTIPTEDHLKWLNWLRNNVFATLSIEATVKPYWATYSNGVKKGQKYHLVDLQTKLSPQLALVYDEWYTGGEWVAHKTSSPYVRNAAKKIPERLTSLTEMPVTTLVQWFLGDGGGTLYYIKDTPKVDTNFSTQGFSKEEVYRLMDMLDGIGIKTTKPHRLPHKAGSGLRIYLAQDSINDFMSLVEPYILEIFGDSEGLSYKDMIKYRPAKMS